MGRKVQGFAHSELWEMYFGLSLVDDFSPETAVHFVPRYTLILDISSLVEP